jgi:group I intron endonuclease
MTGIYKIQSIKKSDRIYIGSAINITDRWSLHLSKLKQGKHHSAKLQNHYNKYGKNDLQFSVLICCDKENLLANEQFFIDSYNPYFNICKKAGSMLGIKRGTISAEHKNNLSKALQGRKSPMKGKHLSEETKQLQREKHLGRHFSPNTEIKKDQHFSLSTEFKKGQTPWNKGIKTGKQSLEVIAKRVEGFKKSIELRKLRNLKESIFIN